MKNENTEKIVIPYKPLSYQKQLHNDRHRFKVLAAGRRSGKTTFAINELIKWALERDLPVPYWYVAPYYHQAKTIAWKMLLKYIPKELRAKNPNESELTLELINNSAITLKGADNPSSLEGTALGGLIVDEVAAISRFTSLWENTLRPMLSDYESPAIFISKPQGYNHFHTLAKIGDHEGIIEGESIEPVTLDLDFITYRFETEQNCHEHNAGYIKHEEIEKARKQLSEEAFNQEYLAKFTKHTGLVHKLFDRDIHVIPFFEVPKEWRRFRGWDFGSTHPTASLRIAIDQDDNWFIEICYKKAELSIKDHTENIKGQDSELGSITGYGDPSGAQWIREFNNQGISIVAARKDPNTSAQSWIQLGIDQINQKLQPKEGHTVFLPNGRIIENAPSFFILRTLENQPLIDEFETLSYKETSGGTNSIAFDDSRDPKGHFDLLAALRYFAVSSRNGINISFVEAPNVNSKEYQDELKKKDEDIKAMLRDPERLKNLEHEADLALIKEQNEIRRKQWWP